MEEDHKITLHTVSTSRVWQDRGHLGKDVVKVDVGGAREDHTLRISPLRRRVHVQSLVKESLRLPSCLLNVSMKGGNAPKDKLATFYTLGSI